MLFDTRAILSWVPRSLQCVLIATCALCVIGVNPISAQSSFFQPFGDTAEVVRYTNYSAAECLAAIARAGRVARRTSAQQTTGWQAQFIENDTVLAVQRRVATDCVKHLATDKVLGRDLPDLARVYWFAGDSVALYQAIQQRLAMDQTDSAQAVTYRQLLTRFLLDSQRDILLVTQLFLPQLNALTSLGSQKTRFQTHVALAYSFASSRHPEAGEASRTHIDAAIQEFERMPAIVQATLVDTIGPLFKLGAAAATETGDTTRARMLLETARRLLPHLPAGAQYVHAAEAVVRYFGMAAPPMHSDFIFGTPPGATSIATWPRPGHWTLIAPMPTSGMARDFYKNLHSTFGETLDIIFFMATRGHWRPRGPLEPKEEADLAYDYLSRRWGMPGILLVEERAFRTLPDGRRIAEATTTPSVYQGSGIVIGPDGNIRAMLEPATLVRFDLLLQSLIQKDRAGIQR